MLFNTQKPAAATPRISGAPTVVLSTDVTGVKQNRVFQPADDYFSIKVDASHANIVADQKVVLFDPSGGYALNEGYTKDADLAITGLTSHYQFMLNDLSHNASYYDTMKITVSKPGDANFDPNSQLARGIDIYRTSKGGKPGKVRTIYPDKGIHEGQFQKNIATFTVEDIIDNRTAYVFTIEDGVVMTFSFYQKAELGRKQ